jgi:hypothetical protein
MWWEVYAGRCGLAAYMDEMLEPRFEYWLAVRIDEKRWIRAGRWSRPFC